MPILVETYMKLIEIAQYREMVPWSDKVQHL